MVTGLIHTQVLCNILFMIINQGYKNQPNDKI